MASTITTTTQALPVELLLLDLDGTLVDSTDAVNKHWTEFGREIGIDSAEILRVAHGRRTIDTLALFCPERANWKNVCEMEEGIPRDHGDGAKVLPGARKLLKQMVASRAPWAIVTSGSSPLARGWLSKMGLPIPEIMITAESVAQGKPDPACYDLARFKLDAKQNGFTSIVFEDSPAGIRAGKAAGCTVVGLVTSHTLEQVCAAGPDWVVRDLASVNLLSRDVNSRDCEEFQLQLEDVLWYAERGALLQPMKLDR